MNKPVLPNPSDWLDGLLPKEAACDVHEDMDGCPIRNAKAAIQAKFKEQEKRHLEEVDAAISGEAVVRDRYWRDRLNKEVLQARLDTVDACVRGLAKVNNHYVPAIIGDLEAYKEQLKQLGDGGGNREQTDPTAFKFPHADKPLTADRVKPGPSV